MLACPSHRKAARRCVVHVEFPLQVRQTPYYATVGGRVRWLNLRPTRGLAGPIGAGHVVATVRSEAGALVLPVAPHAIAAARCRQRLPSQCVVPANPADASAWAARWAISSEGAPAVASIGVWRCRARAANPKGRFGPAADTLAMKGTTCARTPSHGSTLMGTADNATSASTNRPSPACWSWPAKRPRRASGSMAA